MKTVPVELDKPRRLRFDVNALADVEDAMGVGIGAIFQQQVGIRMIRTLLWAGLKWEDPGLTQQRAGLLLQKYLEQGGDLGALVDKLLEALKASGLVGKAEDPNADEAEAAS